MCISACWLGLVVACSFTLHFMFHPPLWWSPCHHLVLGLLSHVLLFSLPGALGLPSVIQTWVWCILRCCPCLPQLSSLSSLFWTFLEHRVKLLSWLAPWLNDSMTWLADGQCLTCDALLNSISVWKSGNFFQFCYFYYRVINRCRNEYTGIFHYPNIWWIGDFLVWNVPTAALRFWDDCRSGNNDKYHFKGRRSFPNLLTVKCRKFKWLHWFFWFSRLMRK